MTFLDRTIKLVRDYDASRARSLQEEPGWSEVGGCRSALGFRLDRAWPSDEPDTWGAIRGTAIHKLFEIVLADEPGFRTEVDTFYRGIPGHADLLVIDESGVADWKGLALTTPIPTPSGWTTMGALRAGDEVFGADGKPCTVTGKSKVKQIGTYVVRFRDGSSVVCDSEHLWWAMRGPGVRGRMEVVGVEDMAASLIKKGQANWRVPVAEPLALPDADLPVNPYVLGCWLGDGSCGNSRVSGAPDIFAEIEKEGFRVGPPPPSQRDKTAPFRNVYGLMTSLRVAGVLFDKHVPDAYLRASVSQRQALLQGLADTDGTWNKARRRAVIEVTSKVIAEGAYELLLSLGEQPHMSWVTRKGFGVQVEACMVEWTPVRFNPFRLRIKAEQVAVSRLQVTRSQFRCVASIEPGPDVQTACIAVDSPNSTYLCGREMIPTHNTTKLANSKLWASKPSALWPKRVQVHGYAAGLVDTGELPEDCQVRLVAIPVDGTFADWWMYEEPFDRSIADWGADRLEWVRERQAAGESLPKDERYEYCRDWCKFFSLCRGQEDGDEGEEIENPELAAAVAAYGEANIRFAEAKKEKDRLAPMIRGLRGIADGWRVSMTRAGEEDEVPDTDAMLAILAAEGIPVPMTTKASTPAKLSVRKIKGAAA